MKSGTIFDNFLITDDESYAEEFGDDTWGATKGPEKEMKDEQDEVERKQREEEEKLRKETEGEDEDDEEFDDEDFEMPDDIDMVSTRNAKLDSLLPKKPLCLEVSNKVDLRTSSEKSSHNHDF